ncbi:MAG: hypothetical protein AB8G18_15655 [Gammaproteobacteria bacterium]
MDSHEDDTIDLWIQPVEVISGKVSEHTKLQTYSDRNCGVEVTLGMRYLIVDGNEHIPLTLCSTGGKINSNRRSIMGLALKVLAPVEIVNTELQQSFNLSRFVGFWRRDANILFEHLDKLGLLSTIIESPTRVRYGNLLFEFKDEQITAVREE